jgi:hypothetical protein
MVIGAPGEGQPCRGMGWEQQGGDRRRGVDGGDEAGGADSCNRGFSYRWSLFRSLCLCWLGVQGGYRLLSAGEVGAPDPH